MCDVVEVEGSGLRLRAEVGAKQSSIWIDERGKG